VADCTKRKNPRATRSPMKKSWSEKLKGAKPAHVEVLPKAMWGLERGDKLFIATPIIVRDYMKKIRKGASKSIAEMRADLARANGAKASCPMTSSIFARIAAEAALEEMNAGKPASAITPFWRLIDEKSPLAKKLSCGPAFIARMRKAEGAGG
jgi:hypothetical protein